jgi:tetratricopeptide (TPR) repeat protein
MGSMVSSMLRSVLAAVLVCPFLALAQAPSLHDAAQQAAAPAAEGGGSVSALLAEADRLYAKRDDPAALAELKASLAHAEQVAPKDYEVLWRQARLNFWLADDPKLKSEEKSKLGKIAWDYGDRATAANPSRVEGWHYASAGVGNYALGIGVITALRQGIEGKFRERISKAEAIDPKFENGGIQTAWGRFWYELPWPKYSAERSQKALEAALKMNPDNVRAWVYLADLHAKENKPTQALEDLQHALANPPGRYDAPEERRYQAVARQRIADLKAARGRGSEGG